MAKGASEGGRKEHQGLIQGGGGWLEVEIAASRWHAWAYAESDRQGVLVGAWQELYFITPSSTGSRAEEFQWTWTSKNKRTIILRDHERYIPFLQNNK